MYDLLIIGAGPAGQAAASSCAQKQWNTLLLDKKSPDKVVVSVEAGKALEIKYNTEVIGLERNITSFVVQDKTGEDYYSRAVIVASGHEPHFLDILGSEKFFNKGVAFGNTFDLLTHKDKDVAVVGGGDSAMETLLALSKVARRIYSININNQFEGDEVLKQKIMSILNIKFFTNTKALEVSGTGSVESIKIQALGQAEQVLPVQGVLLEANHTPNTSFDLLTEKNGHGYIKVDQNMQTSIPGIFAVGDVNDALSGPPELAEGEGVKAALAVNNYLNKTK
jgi:thioredoxin reductase